MKTTLSVVVMACLAITALPKNGFSQTKTDALSFPTLIVAPVVLPMAEAAGMSGNFKANQRALKDFSKSNKNAVNVGWYKVSGGFMAHYSTPDMDTKVSYDDNGRWLYNLCTYMEDRLPFAIRDMVKGEYYDYKILVCYAYEIPGGPVYLIKMEGRNTIKTVRVLNDEMVETESYTKN